MIKKLNKKLTKLNTFEDLLKIYSISLKKKTYLKVLKKKKKYIYKNDLILLKNLVSFQYNNLKIFNYALFHKKKYIYLNILKKFLDSLLFICYWRSSLLKYFKNFIFYKKRKKFKFSKNLQFNLKKKFLRGKIVYLKQNRFFNFKNNFYKKKYNNIFYKRKKFKFKKSIVYLKKIILKLLNLVYFLSLLKYKKLFFIFFKLKKITKNSSYFFILYLLKKFLSNLKFNRWIKDINSFVYKFSNKKKNHDFFSLYKLKSLFFAKNYKKYFFKNSNLVNLFFQDKLKLKFKKKFKNFRKKRLFYIYKKYKKKKKKNFLKKRLKNYFNSFFSVNHLSSNNVLINKLVSKRFFFYDYFHTNFDKNIFFLKYYNNNSFNLLWKNKINKTFLRFRLSEYLILVFLNDNKFLKNKLYFILSFYKFVIYFKIELLKIKKYLKKKLIVYKNKKIKKNKKILKYYLSKIFLLKKLNLKKNIYIFNNYIKLLKYFNNFCFFFFFNLNWNIKLIINSFKPFVYLSYLINVSLDRHSKYINLFSFGNIFIKKISDAYKSRWFIFDSIFNYYNIIDLNKKKTFYLNYLSPLKNLVKKNFNKNFYIVPLIKRNIDSQFTYFLNKSVKQSKIKINKFKFSIFNKLLLYINLLFIYNKSLLNLFDFYFWKYNKYLFKNKFYIFFFNTNIKIINLHILNIFLFIKNLSNFLLFFFLLFLKNNFFYKNSLLKLNNFFFFKKKNYLIKNIFIFNNIIIKKKKIILINLLKLFFFFNLKFFFYFIGLSILNFFLFFFFFKIIFFFTYLNKYFLINLKKKNFKLLLKFKKKNFNFLMTLKKKNFLDFNIINYYLSNKYNNYYSSIKIWFKYFIKRGILHLVEKKSNNFLVLSLFKQKRVIGHTSAGQGMYRLYNNKKRQKKSIPILIKIISKKLRKKVRKFRLKEIVIKSNGLWNYRVKKLTKYWVLRYKLGARYLKGIKVDLNLPFHTGLRLSKRRRK